MWKNNEIPSSYSVYMCYFVVRVQLKCAFLLQVMRMNL